MMPSQPSLQALPERQRPPAPVLAFLRRTPAEYRAAACACDAIAARAMKGGRMEPTREDIEALRGIVNWAKTHRGDSEIRIRALAEGIERAISILETRRDSVTEMLLVAMHQAMKPLGVGNHWIIVDRDLFDFVGRELVKRYGQNPGYPPRDR